MSIVENNIKKLFHPKVRMGIGSSSPAGVQSLNQQAHSHIMGQVDTYFTQCKTQKRSCAASFALEYCPDADDEHHRWKLTWAAVDSSEGARAVEHIEMAKELATNMVTPEERREEVFDVPKLE